MHPNFIIGYDACRKSWADDDYYYSMMGNEHKCPKCNYSYWENLHTEKYAHDWVWNSKTHNYKCSGCDRIK